MPELPEVETIARDLDAQLVGHRIVDVQVLWARSVDGCSIDAFRDRLRGHEVIRVGRRGKYLIFQLDAQLFMLVHLRMTGQLLLCPLSADAQKHVRVAFELDDGRQLLFRDMRKFGRIYLVRDPGEIVAKLGPEPFSDQFDEKAFADRLGRRRGMLKPLLLDQSFIAGIGNIYADEALFAAGLHPRRCADSLGEEDISRLFEAIRQVLKTAIANRGTTLSDYQDARGQKGRNQHHLTVFRRAEEPCPRCGRPIQRDRVSGRGTFFCANCQV